MVHIKKKKKSLEKEKTLLSLNTFERLRNGFMELYSFASKFIPSLPHVSLSKEYVETIMSL